jgi:hypothetical protein
MKYQYVQITNISLRKRPYIESSIAKERKVTTFLITAVLKLRGIRKKTVKERCYLCSGYPSLNSELFRN